LELLIFNGPVIALYVMTAVLVIMIIFVIFSVAYVNKKVKTIKEEEKKQS
jgi:ABC-type bacteriocin/lantibiotic exporter with double-glycine peptidase domain